MRQPAEVTCSIRLLWNVIRILSMPPTLQLKRRREDIVIKAARVRMRIDCAIARGLGGKSSTGLIDPPARGSSRFGAGVAILEVMTPSSGRRHRSWDLCGARPDGLVTRSPALGAGGVRGGMPCRSDPPLRFWIPDPGGEGGAPFSTARPCGGRIATA